MASPKARQVAAKRSKAAVKARGRAAPKPPVRKAPKSTPAAKDLPARIRALAIEVMEKKSQLARMRLEMPPVAVKDYELVTSDGSPTTLSALFGGQRDMWFIRSMGQRCSYCTLWADGLNAFAFQLVRRAAFVVCSPDPPQQQATLKAARGWRFAMVSAATSRIFHELGYQKDADEHFSSPGLIVFRKAEDGSITKVSATGFGPGDSYCPAWDLLELLPDGQDGWEPNMKPPPTT